VEISKAALKRKRIRAAIKREIRYGAPPDPATLARFIIEHAYTGRALREGEREAGR
jgi:hypothetical protein